MPGNARKGIQDRFVDDAASSRGLRHHGGFADLLDHPRALAFAGIAKGCVAGKQEEQRYQQVCSAGNGGFAGAFTHGSGSPAYDLLTSSMALCVLRCSGAPAGVHCPR